MPNTPDKRPDVAGMRQRLLDACVGKPAKIPWPHRLLHDAADHIEKLEEEVRGWRDCIIVNAQMDGAKFMGVKRDSARRMWGKSLAALGDGNG